MSSEEKYKDNQGTPMSKEYNNGPIENRSCTDIICCLLFICSIIAMFGIAITGWSKGTPLRLTLPYDSDGKSCGGDYPNNPYIYFSFPFYVASGQQKYLNRTTCVSECPTLKLIQTSCSLNPNTTSPSTNNSSSNTTNTSSNATNTSNNTQNSNATKNQTFKQSARSTQSSNSNTNQTNNNTTTTNSTNTNNTTTTNSTNTNTTTTNQTNTNNTTANSTNASNNSSNGSNISSNTSNTSSTPILTDWANGTLPCSLNCQPTSLIKSCAGNLILNPGKISTNVNVISLLSNYTALDNQFIIYNTTPVFQRLCIPFSTDILSQVSGNVEIGQLQQYMSDVQTAWWIILLSVLIALVMGFIFMMLLKYIAGIITWLAVLSFIAGIFILGGAFYQRAINMENSNEAASQQGNIKDLKYLSYAIFALGGVCIIMFCCLFNKIRLAIAIIKTAADFVKGVPQSIFIPPIFALIIIGYWAVWIVSMVYIYAIGDIQPANGYPFASVKWDNQTRYMLVYFIFGGLWKNAFLVALCQFTLASATCIWYFSVNSQGGCHNAITRSLWRGLFKHIGSLAFGSLILAIVQFIRLVLYYIDQQLKKSGAYNGNKLLEYLMKCLQCYAWCFENVVKFLNKNAYIQIAITGKNFCSAAKDGFFLILRNPADFGLVVGLGEVFIFVGKLFITISSTTISYYIMINVDSVKSKLYSSMLPMILCAVIGYAIGVLFMTVYGTAADAILQCYLVDEEINDGNTQNSPETLRDFVKNNVKDSKK